MGVTMQRANDGVAFRDLNKNGRLDPYEDPRRPVGERVTDLLAQMTVEEKAGLMFHTIAAMNPDGSLTPPSQGFSRTPISEMVVARLMSHFNLHAVADPRVAVEWHNRVQALAEGTRLGIPVTFSSDPRHAFSNNPLASLRAGKFSQWPEPIGLAAIGDPALVFEFADIARQEYLAVGIRVALHPMADLATEPRWGRISGTFGEDADLAARLVAAYIRGFQGSMPVPQSVAPGSKPEARSTDRFQGATIGPQSVACMTKHFPGGGPQKDGEDPHFSYGKEQVYPGGNFDYHLRPFEAAFAAGTAQIMPYYGVPMGLQFEEVGFSFNRDVITGLLRGKYGFDGVVCTDWGLLTPLVVEGRVVMEARAWGVEELSIPARAQKALDAGVDQFGGEACPEVIVELVRSGQVPEARIDQSVRRLLRDKFRLGLFDNPYLDPDTAERIVGQASFREAGELAQRRSIVLLKNAATPDGMALPLRGRPRMVVENIAPETAQAYGQVVDRVEEAEVAVLRVNAPFEVRGEGFERMFHRGDLSFAPDERDRILAVAERAPTVVVIHLDRPAVIPEIAARSAALLGEFGASDAAVLDVIFGRFAPSGKLPFELPSSMEAVRKQREDLPYDSERPLFPFGHGLTY